MGAQKIGFDGWVLDPDSGDLERAGTRIRLQEQPLQVLLELIDSRGGVVTREQLISKLWPKGIVDFDTGLNTAIRKLRVALGDTADTPRYIETLPRRGTDLSQLLSQTRHVNPNRRLNRTLNRLLACDLAMYSLHGIWRTRPVRRRFRLERVTAAISHS